MWFPTIISCVLLALLTTVTCNLGSDVTFYLSTHEQNRTEITDDNLDAINVENPTFVLIHGWRMQSTSDWVIDLTAALLERNVCNVIAVDYTSIAELDYVTSVADSRAVAEFTAERLVNLSTNYSANLADFELIGHSLGAHIAGFIGKNVQNLTGSNVSRIIGLDPAGPLFLPTDPDGRLANTDADIVVALHSDGLVYGYYNEIGGIDFYANGGTAPQPGCLEDDFQATRCSHLIAPLYYAEAVLHPDGFVATNCGDYSTYQLGLCSENNKITLGGNFTQSEFGKYYFNTNSESPYSQE